MRFNKEEIEVILRQHVVDHWGIQEDIIGPVEIQVFDNTSKPGGHRVWADVPVSTNPKEGGGPYRIRG